jgi:hypothetical protein
MMKKKEHKKEYKNPFGLSFWQEKEQEQLQKEQEQRQQRQEQQNNRRDYTKMIKQYPLGISFEKKDQEEEVVQNSLNTGTGDNTCAYIYDNTFANEYMYWAYYDIINPLEPQKSPKSQEQINTLRTQRYFILGNYDSAKMKSEILGNIVELLLKINDEDSELERLSKIIEHGHSIIKEYIDGKRKQEQE